VIGSSVKTKYEIRDGKPAIVRLPEIDFIDDKAGKPVGIHSTSVGGPLRLSAIPTATSRCWST